MADPRNVVPPNLPVPAADYNQQTAQQESNVLRLYFNQLCNTVNELVSRVGLTGQVLTFNGLDAGDPPGVTYDGSTPVTVSANTVGALSLQDGGTVNGKVTINGPGDSSAFLTLQDPSKPRLDLYQGATYKSSINHGASGHMSISSSEGLWWLTSNFPAIKIDTSQNVEFYGGNVTIDAPVSGAGLTVLTGAGNPHVNLNGSTSGTISLTTAAAAGTWTLTMPPNAGSAGYVLRTDGAGVTTWVAQTGTTINPITFNNSGSGVASGTTFNGSVAETISYNTLGAYPTTGGTISGNVTINPASGTALTVNGIAGSWAEYIQGANTGAGTSYGLIINAANTTDYAIEVNNYNNSAGLFSVQGNGAFVLGKGAGWITGNSSGNVTINAPSSGVALTASSSGAGNSAGVFTGVAAGNTPLVLLNGTTTGASYFKINSSGGNYYIGADNSTSTGLLSGSAYALCLVTESAQAIQFGTNNISRGIISSSGNWTINAPSSGTALTVSAIGGNNALQLTASAATQTGISLGQSGQTLWQIYQPASSNDLRFYDGTGDRLKIATGGNVTINAPSSGTALTIAGGGATVTGNVNIPNNFVSSEGWQSNGTAYTTAAGIFNGIYGKASNTIGIATGGNEIVLIGSAGNVTINAPSSGTALQVTGVAGATGISVAGTTTGAAISAGGAIKISADAANNAAEIDITNTGASGRQWRFGDGIGFANGNFGLYDATAGAARWYTSATGNVTINAPSSGTALTVNAVASGTALLCQAAASSDCIAIWNLNGSVQQYQLYIKSSDNTFRIKDNNAGADRFSLSSTGNFSLSAPSSGTTLTVNAVANGVLESYSDGTHTGLIGFNGGVGSEFQIGTTSAYGFGVFTNNALRFYANSSGNVTINAPSSGNALTLNPAGATAALTIPATSTNNASIALQSSGKSAYQIYASGSADEIRIYDGTNDVLKIATGGAATFNKSLGVGTAGSGTTGEIRATNNITAFYSDMRLKDVVAPITGALEKVKTLDVFTFKANETAQALGYDGTEVHVGVSAQQVKEVLPEIIKPAPIDPEYMTLDYAKLVPLLIGAVKELSQQVADLSATIQEMRSSHAQ